MLSVVGGESFSLIDKFFLQDICLKGEGNPKPMFPLPFCLKFSNRSPDIGSLGEGGALRGVGVITALTRVSPKQIFQLRDIIH